MKAGTRIYTPSETTIISRIKNQSGQKKINLVSSPPEASMKHDMFYNLSVLLKVLKHEKEEEKTETAAAILRGFRFLNLIRVPDLNTINK